MTTRITEAMNIFLDVFLVSFKRLPGGSFFHVSVINSLQQRSCIARYAEDMP